MAPLVGLSILAGAFAPAAAQTNPQKSDSQSAESQGAESSRSESGDGSTQPTATGGPRSTVPLDGSTPLPWDNRGQERSRLPVRELGGARELLELYGVDESHIRQLFDGRPAGIDEEEAIVRILFRLPQFGLDNVDRWAQSPVPGAAMVADPEAHRIQFFRLRGRVRRVERRELIPELARLYDFDSYYRVYLDRADDPHPVLVCARRVPEVWPLDQPLDEGARIDALFLKVGDDTQPPATLLFAADRVAWLPAEPRPEWDVTAHQVLLAQLGMDISLLADMRDRNRRPMGEQDREAFYQMLAAVRELTPGKAAEVRADPLDLAPLLLEPETQHGRLIRCRGTARRITRVVVDDPDIRQRFGIDHYFQLDVSLPLGDRTIRLGKSSEEGPVFTNSFPATFCVLRLPPRLERLAEAMSAGELQAETLNEQVSLTGFYFKLWAFRSEYVASFDERQRQIAPMLVAAEPEVIEFRLARNTWLSLLAGVGFLLLLLLAWFGVWRFNRSDTRFERSVIRRQFEVRGGKSLNDAGIEAPDGPDFSNLD